MGEVFEFKVHLGDAITDAPFSYRTGKLNQFIGFATPHPFPSNAQFSKSPFSKNLHILC